MKVLQPPPSKEELEAALKEIEEKDPYTLLRVINALRPFLDDDTSVEEMKPTYAHCIKGLYLDTGEPIPEDEAQLVNELGEYAEQFTYPEDHQDEFLN